MKPDRHELLVPEEGFARPDLVEMSAIGPPPATPILEENRGVPGGMIGKIHKEGIRFETDRDQGKQAASPAIARPDDLVLPLGIVPMASLDRIDATQGIEEPGFEPLATEPELPLGSFRHDHLACLA